MRKLLIILPFLTLMLVSCGRGRMLPPREVSIENSFEIAVPENLVPRNDLHDFAPLQYADEQGGYFLIGIVEPKLGMEQLQLFYKLDDYAYFVESTIADGFDTVNVTQRDTFELQGVHFQTCDLFAAVNDEEAPLEVYYHISVMETPTHFYQLLAWTKRDRRYKLQEAATAMELSFKELHQAQKAVQTATANKRSVK